MRPTFLKCNKPDQKIWRVFFRQVMKFYFFCSAGVVYVKGEEEKKLPESETVDKGGRL